MIVTRMGKLECDHKWFYYAEANTQICLYCGRCETPNV